MEDDNGIMMRTKSLTNHPILPNFERESIEHLINHLGTSKRQIFTPFFCNWTLLQRARKLQEREIQAS
jgi:hypothetical protein